MTKQEQIKAIKQIIDERVETNLGQVQGRHGNVIKTVDTIIIARDIVEAGYGDVSEYKAENERLTKILNSLTFSRKETDIFGKPALLMFAGVKVEEAIKRVTEYNGLKAENEDLKDEIIYLERRIAIRDNALKDRDRAIEMLEGKQDTIVKQAKIDVLNELKGKMFEREYMGVKYKERIFYESEIDDMIAEVQNGKDKG